MDEKRRRIMVSVWAYAYEVNDESLVDDATYDREARLINPTVSTDRPDLDEFFRTEFEPYTGAWVRSHPDKGRLKQLAFAFSKYPLTKQSKCGLMYK